MTAFHTIAILHDDILQGRLMMDVFVVAKFLRLKAVPIRMMKKEGCAEHGAGSS